jgi:hypothetical protein
MALNTRISLSARDVQLNALAPRLNNGYIRVFTGAQPATPNTAASGTQVAELRFGATAFPTLSGPSGGPLVANAITDDADADATGTAGYFRCYESDGVTPVIDGECGTSGANMNFNSLAIQIHARVTALSFTHALPMQGA